MIVLSCSILYTPHGLRTELFITLHLEVAVCMYAGEVAMERSAVSETRLAQRLCDLSLGLQLRRCFILCSDWCCRCSLALPLYICSVPDTMSDSENDASVLGKRSRNGQEAEEHSAKEVEAQPDPMDAEDDSEDDVGPMPMPVDAAGPVAKKKRKGQCIIPRAVCHRRF